MHIMTGLLTPAHILTLIAAVSVLWMLYEYLHRKKHRLAAMLAGTGSGIAALLLAHFYGDAIGFAPPLTLCTVGIAAVGGIPGVLLLAALHFLNW